MTKIEQYLEKCEGIGPWITGGEQGRVDLKVLPFLNHIEDGFFVEAGALDGLFMSNTKILEDCGWNGLLIEPSRRAVVECKKNRKCLVEECALVSKDYTHQSVVGDFIFDGESGMGAWSSITRKAYGYQANGQFTPVGSHVRARTLDSVLEQHGIKKIDFFSLDVEGYELEVLNGLDLNAIDVSFILIEINLRDYTLEDVEKKLVGYRNLGCLSNFTKENNVGYDGSHNDYLFAK